MGRAKRAADRGKIKDAIAQFDKARNADQDRDWNEQREKLDKIATNALVKDAKREAYRGNIEKANRLLTEAQNLGLEIDPGKLDEVRAQALIGVALKQARKGELDDAFAQIERIQSEKSDIEISARTWNSLCWSGVLWRKGEQAIKACDNALEIAPEDGGIHDSRGVARVLTGDTEGAIKDFEEYVEWAPSHRRTEKEVAKRKKWIIALETDGDPEINADLADVFAKNLHEVVKDQAKNDGVDAALATIGRAQSLNSDVTISAKIWNEVCWYGALSDNSAQVTQRVMDACDKAVSNDPENGAYRDSRGVARVRTGDFEGAIEDFQAYLKWAQNHGRRPSEKDKRKEWIKVLESRGKPFTPQVLKELRRD
jgi:tetratricopeptide (TPR) repeat protein